jgi:hypothetical protein
MRIGETLFEKWVIPKPLPKNFWLFDMVRAANHIKKPYKVLWKRVWEKPFSQRKVSPRFRFAYFFAFSITSLIFTGAPPWRLLSSAASMNANMLIVSSGSTGATPVWKNLMIWASRFA